MSIPIQTIACTGCSDRWSSAMLLGQWDYKLPSGALLSIRRAIGWCSDCQSLKPVEDLGRLRTQWEVAVDLIARQGNTTPEWRRTIALLTSVTFSQALVFLATVPLFWVQTLLRRYSGQPNRGLLQAHRMFAKEHFDQLLNERHSQVESRRQCKALTEFFSARRSSARCLTCGSLAAAQILSWEEHAHPGCHGQLRVEEPGLRIALIHRAQIYGVNGEPIDATEDSLDQV